MPTKKNKFINEFNEFTNDEGIDNMIKHDKINYQKSQTEVKDSANVAITENCIRFVNTKAVPHKRTYVSTTKHGKEICIARDSHIKLVRGNTFSYSINNGNA